MQEGYCTFLSDTVYICYYTSGNYFICCFLICSLYKKLLYYMQYADVLWHCA